MLLNTQNISQKTNKQSMLIAFPSYFSCSSRLVILLHKMKFYFIFIHLTILLGAYWTRRWEHDDMTSSQLRRQEKYV